MRKLLLTFVLIFAGCLATENRKVEITQRQGIAAADSGSPASVRTTTLWWRLPYYENRKDHPMDKFIPAEDLPAHLRRVDPLEEELKYFSENTLRWPEKMREPYREGPIWVTPSDSEKSALERRLEQPLRPHPKGELY